jgi:FG-GAP repeat protein
MTIAGATRGDRLGSSVAVIGGSVLAGAPGASRGAGAAYLVRGRRGSFRIGGRGVMRITGAAAGDAAGTSVARIGDVNGDGVPDFAIGAPGADPAGRTGAGAVYVVFGGQRGPLDLGALGDRGFEIDGPLGRGRAGMKVAPAGDLNGDGLADLVVLAAGVRSFNLDSLGELFVVYGKRDTAPVDLAALGAGGYAIAPAGPGISLVSGLAGGVNVGGSRQPDIASGMFQDMDEGAGEVFVMVDGAGANPVTVDIGPRLKPPALGWYATGGGADSENGWSLAETRDMNRDRIGELIVGAPGDGCSRPCVGFPDTGQNPLSQSGTVFVIFGQPAGAGVSLTPGQGLKGYRIYGPRKGASIGTAVAAAGDMNRDGIPDVAIGGPGKVPGLVPVGRRTGGEAFVVYGRRSHGVIRLARLGKHGFAIGGRHRGDRLGASVAAGNVLGGRRAELVAGAPAVAHGRGAVYVAAPPR